MITKHKKDYRNTSYNELDHSLGEKKIKFMDEFKLDFPRAWNIYNNINKNGKIYNVKFKNLYYNKCVYCGISTQVINSSNFEVDHFIPKAVLDLNLGYDKKHIQGIKNLVNSCTMCNRGKLDFLCNSEALYMLHPDNNQLPLIFNRKTDLSIEIKKEYDDNDVIKEFYTKLKLNNQLRRLDYLLMEMKDFCDKYEGEPIINEIQKLILKIESKRRKDY
ncbi:HNH endonuclease [Bacillus sp. mrc49]|uniref:HNH endonuclease n=1 Tax=Bacillus sp. mrc49 TaxID=2054913 RepID=UPI0012FE4D7B|nr:HNH endonuclease signature motif containing protein [Bacillus sp. mrc49]